MKTIRNLSSSDLIKILERYGYEVSRQKGSHIRLSRTTGNTTHHITIPNHDPLKIGTLSSILNDVAASLKISKDELLNNG
ncbi:type II toxin-antitoxin system HicA family toxin [Pedobacter sp. SAFR-022]|uniref:type II toxin-antitoxin system HicA family toxin n=1 Tax=Pedobacter sp. SAFR-022 TaxID=3436861 RepID=UPI003F7CD410